MKEVESKILEITEKLGGHRQQGQELRFKYCPCCDEYKEKNPHFSINPVTGVYFCHVKNEGGHINQLKGFEDLDVRKLKELTTGNAKPKKTPQELGEIFKKTVSLNQKWLDYLRGRGISEKVACKVARMGKFGMLAIPITNGKEVVGIKYRTLQKDPSSESGSVSQYLVNWQNVKNHNFLIITEGEIDLMSALEVDFDNVVSLPFGASNLKAIVHQKEWLKNFKEVIIAVDNDVAGWKCKKEIIEILKDTSVKLSEVDFREFKDINEVLTVGGVETLKKLLNEPKEIIMVKVEEEKEHFSLGISVDNFSKLPPSLKNKEVVKILKYLKKDYKKIGGLLYCKFENYYVKMGATDFIKYVSVREQVTFSKVLKEEMMNIIEFGIENEPFPKEEESIMAFNDGLLNIYTGEEVEEKDQFIYWRADCTREELINNQATVWEKHFKEKLGDEQTKVLLSFLYLSMLNRHNRFILIYYSNGRDGKGTCMESLGELFYKSRNYGFFKPEVFLSEFNTYNLFMKDVAVIDEVEKIPVATAKQITGNSITQAEKKGIQAIEIRHNLSLILLSNDTVGMRSFNKAERGRFILIKHITDTLVADDRIAQELKDNKVELLKLILTVGRKHFHEKKGHIIYHNEEMLEEYEELNNPFEYHLRKDFEKGDFERNFVTLTDIDLYFLEIGMAREWDNLLMTAKGLLVKKISGEKARVKKINGKTYRVIPLKRLQG